MGNLLELGTSWAPGTHLGDLYEITFGSERVLSRELGALEVDRLKDKPLLDLLGDLVEYGFAISRRPQRSFLARLLGR